MTSIRVRTRYGKVMENALVSGKVWKNENGPGKVLNLEGLVWKTAKIGLENTISVWSCSCKAFYLKIWLKLNKKN